GRRCATISAGFAPGALANPFMRRPGLLSTLLCLKFFWSFSETVNSLNSSVIYQFGPFRLEVKEHRLLRGERPVPLAGKAFETLCVLVRHHGSLLPKDELLAALWPETNVEENNLDRNISTLRKALGEKSASPRYIETVPRVGYRFVGEVTCLTE